MTGTPYNVDLMLQVREQITAHPETHNQASWVYRTTCGTTMCIAGWATTAAGLEIFEKESARPEYVVDDLAFRGRRSIQAAAKRLLGLDADEARALFCGDASHATALALLDRFIDAGKNGERVCLD